MRQRNIKNLRERIEQNFRLLIREPWEARSRWGGFFGNDGPLYLEIGCGKGNFITRHALEEPEGNFIACEGQESVVLRALEKAEESQIGNLRIFIDYVNDLGDYFAPGELSGIYLNFSDPWPKARHTKRRLTYRRRQENYKAVLREGGFLEFKTDNDGLFEFSRGEIREAGYEILEATRDLHGGFDGQYGTKSRRFMTEYEAKFAAGSKSISFLRAVPK